MTDLMLEQVRRFLDDPALKRAVLARVTAKVTPDTQVIIGHSLGIALARLLVLVIILYRPTRRKWRVILERRRSGGRKESDDSGCAGSTRCALSCFARAIGCAPNPSILLSASRLGRCRHFIELFTGSLSAILLSVSGTT